MAEDMIGAMKTVEGKLTDIKQTDIRKIRENILGLTQEKLARELDVITTSVARWELGTHGIEPLHLRKLEILVLKKQGKFPDVCKVTKGRPFKPSEFMAHAKECDRCRLNLLDMSFETLKAAGEV